tara:strand:- start:5324 stop:6004 length:681 start_codon:yes stop_codon:yes gene_type:complete
MTTDSRTNNRNYAKPYPSNLLAADVIRLGQALDAIDVDMAARLTQADVATLIQTAVDDLVSGSTAALDTLQELAAALGDDANFATTVTNSISTKLDKAGGTLTGQVTLPSNPQAGTLQAATALYVENSHTTWGEVNNLDDGITLDANKRYLVDTTGGAFTVELPAAPTSGDYIEFLDAAGKFDVNNLTIDRNSLKIMGLDEDMTVAKLNASFRLVYANATSGWRIN